MGRAQRETVRAAISSSRPVAVWILGGGAASRDERVVRGGGGGDGEGRGDKRWGGLWADWRLERGERFWG